MFDFLRDVVDFAVDATSELTKATVELTTSVAAGVIAEPLRAVVGDNIISDGLWATQEAITDLTETVMDDALAPLTKAVVKAPIRKVERMGDLVGGLAQATFTEERAEGLSRAAGAVTEMAAIALTAGVAGVVLEHMDVIAEMVTDVEVAELAADSSTEFDIAAASVTPEPVAGASFLHYQQQNHFPRFSGLAHTEWLADQQTGPVCGSEALENFLQLDNPTLSNDLSDVLQRSFGNQQGIIPFDAYQTILEQYGHLTTSWHSFDHGQLHAALQANHGVLLVGDAHELNPALYSQPNGWHAFTVTDVRWDTQGVPYYIGLDSNVPGQECVWTSAQLESAVGRAEQFYGRGCALISHRALRWPYTTS
jgi:hypothetical protein